MFGQTTAPKNKFQEYANKTQNEAKSPVDEQDRITYGIIDEVDDDTSQVKIRRLLADGKTGDLISEGFLPLVTPLSQIHLLWGMLRKGLVCRIYWKGKFSPKKGIIEVIGDEDTSFLRKKSEPNEVEIGPWKLMT